LGRTPSVDGIVRFLDRQVADLNRIPADDEDYPVTTLYTEEGVQIEVSFYRYNEPIEPSDLLDDRAVMVGPAIGGIVTTGLRLQKTLTKKRPSRYAVDDVQYAIVGYLHDEFSSLHQLERAVFGSQSINVVDQSWSRSNDGFFGRRDAERFKISESARCSRSHHGVLGQRRRPRCFD
jgi:hypothetical protein